MDKKFSDYVISKPWGYEYLLFENYNIGIWFLHIKYNECTSLHCHPNKKTGLIILNGEAEVYFLNNKIILKSNDKTMIWPGVFHSTLAKSKNGIDILEVESPKNKFDLVRIKDRYGRENTKYEGESKWYKKTMDHLWLENKIETSIKYGTYTLSIKKVSKDFLNDSAKSDIIVVLENPIVLAHQNTPVCRVGDVLKCDTLTYLSNQFQINENSIILHIKNENS